ncbi:MAG: sigma-70 family RNA polymerase sigma factor [Chloroflexi bacterium]|nr:sigma-70 family RNA polymerase sigma factor [Chloroflexota bacterium]
MGRQAAPSLPADFAQVYRDHVTRVYRYVYARVGNREDAEDLTAQVFFDALEKWASYRDEGKVAAWLLTIARRRVADYYRRHSRPLSLDVVPFLADPHTPWDGVEKEEELAHLARLVAQLSDEDQELLRLRFAAGLTYREMADIVGRSEAAVKMAVHRLIRRLARMWEASYEHA